MESPPCNVANVGSIPGRGAKIPHATGQLGPRATATELVRHNWREAHVPQQKIPRASMKIPHAAAKT